MALQYPQQSLFTLLLNTLEINRSRALTTQVDGIGIIRINDVFYVGKSKINSKETVHSDSNTPLIPLYIMLVGKLAETMN